MSEYSHEVHLLTVPFGPLYAGHKILRPDGTHIVTISNGPDAEVVVSRLNKDGAGQFSISGNSAKLR